MTSIQGFQICPMRSNGQITAGSTGMGDSVFENSTSIQLPVSIGEALDKLSILEIKLDKIKDKRRNDVQKEYDAIYSNLHHLFTSDAKFHYKCLKEVNQTIWDDQDIFRESKDNEEKNKLCMKIIVENDRRFRIKSKLNALFNSSLREQKGYKKRKAFFLGHLGMGDMINCNGIVRWLATEYEEVKVVCKRSYSKNCKQMYNDDPCIQFHEVESDAEISPRFGYPLEKFNEVVRGYDVYCVGYHVLNKHPHIYELPLSFYDDISIDRKKLFDYFHCAKGSQLKIPSTDQPYIFVHNTSSNGKVFEINKDDSILFINPNENMYTEDHPFYKIAKEYIGHQLFSYIDLMKNARECLFTDSSFFCLAWQIKKNAKWFYVSRKSNYDYILDNPYRVKEGYVRLEQKY